VHKFLPLHTILQGQNPRPSFIATICIAPVNGLGGACREANCRSSCPDLETTGPPGWGPAPPGSTKRSKCI